MALLKRSIAGIAFKGDKILVMKRLPKGALANRWEFPGGKLEEGESPEEALVREWQEELEVDIKVGDQISESRFKHGDDCFLLLSYRVYPKSENWVFHEHSEARWVTEKELFELDLAESDRRAAEIIFV